MKSYLSRKNLHLVISVLIVVPAAFVYGINPAVVLPALLDIDVYSVDLKNVFRAVMCLYLGLAGIWVLGIVKPGYWKFATLLVIVFMGCLGLGRLISVLFDGAPSDVFLFGIFGELFLTAFSFWQFRWYKS